MKTLFRPIEFTVIFFGKVLISCFSFLRGFKASKPDPFLVSRSYNQPAFIPSFSFFTPVNASSTDSCTPLWPINHVLPVLGCSQIVGMIVRCVSVFMINLFRKKFIKHQKDKSASQIAFAIDFNRPILSWVTAASFAANFNIRVFRGFNLPEHPARDALPIKPFIYQFA